jgi:tetratricopeptide (TPR) repeat protein
LGSVYFDKGEKYSQQNNADSSKIFYQIAVQHFNKATSLNPMFTKAWFGLYWSHKNLGMEDIANAERDSAIHIVKREMRN